MDSPLEQMEAMYIPVTVSVKTGKKVYALVDADYDGEWFSTLPWRLINGYVSIQPHLKRHNPEFPLFLHQFVLPPKEGYWTHFKNGDHLDCRSANLEYMKPKELINRFRPLPKLSPRAADPKSATYSQYRGVSRINRYQARMIQVKWPRGGVLNKWHAHVGKVSLGFFDDELEAARAYDTAAIKRYGIERAVLNFPEEHGKKGA